MIGNNKIQCLCCNKPLNLLSVEPEFYCGICLKRKDIHNSENGVNPIKWYSKISNEIKSCQSIISRKIYKINNVTGKGIKLTQFRMAFRIESLKALIVKLKSEKDKKIAAMNALREKQKRVKSKLKDVLDHSTLTTNSMTASGVDQTNLIDKILTIQTYLNKVQCIFIGEIFSLFPITLHKYEKDKICDLLFHIELSDSSVLESNDSTASAILLLTILATSITYILDICYSSMDVKKFSFRTICHESEPLKRDEIMCVYRFLVRTVHHITQATLFRMDMDGDEMTRLVATDTMVLTSTDELSAENYPLKKLVVLRDNLNVALQMVGISNPYVLKLSNMFQNEYINDFSVCSKIGSPVKLVDIMDFVELSSIIPMNELPSMYQQQVSGDNTGITEWLSWVKSRIV